MTPHEQCKINGSILRKHAPPPPAGMPHIIELNDLPVQGYLAHKKVPPPPRTTVGT